MFSLIKEKLQVARWSTSCGVTATHVRSLRPSFWPPTSATQRPWRPGAPPWDFFMGESPWTTRAWNDLTCGRKSYQFNGMLLTNRTRTWSLVLINDKYHYTGIGIGWKFSVLEPATAQVSDWLHVELGSPGMAGPPREAVRQGWAGGVMRHSKILF